jgi:hypothetical protein
MSAFISVVAAIYACRQARAARRWANAAYGDVPPRFYYELHEDSGRPPWGSRLKIRNHDRRPIRIKRVRVRVPNDLVVWDANDSRPIQAIIEAAGRPEKGAAFDINLVMEGVSPNAAFPAIYNHDFHVGLRAGTSEKKRLVNGAVLVEWEYAWGKASSQTVQISINLPIRTD